MCLDSGSSQVGLNPSSILFKLCDLGLNLSLLPFLIYQMGITIDSSNWVVKITGVIKSKIIYNTARHTVMAMYPYYHQY